MYLICPGYDFWLFRFWRRNLSKWLYELKIKRSRLYMPFPFFIRILYLVGLGYCPSFSPSLKTFKIFSTIRIWLSYISWVMQASHLQNNIHSGCSLILYTFGNIHARWLLIITIVFSIHMKYISKLWENSLF